MLGYTPRSRRGARATINLTFTRRTSADNIDTVILPKGTLFSTQINGVRYTFSTKEDYESIYNNTTERFEFTNVVIVQGRPIEEKFLVDSGVQDQVFKISDKNIDTSTLEVRVQGHGNVFDAEIYLDAANFSSYDSDSKVYFLSENYEGLYQIAFGNGVVGKKLANLNMVELSYLTSSGAEANGARNFTFGRAPAGSTLTQSTDLLKLVVVEPAYGGDEREGIEVIRAIAPQAFIAQKRAVTINDYEALLLKNIPDLEAVSVWGGEKNNPPVYGKVFLAAKPKGALFLSDQQKAEILTYLSANNVVTVTPEIVDTNYIYLSFDIYFKYNAALTTASTSQLETEVRNRVTAFNTQVLGGFDKVFRYSRFLDEIDSTNDAIVNSFARIKVHKMMRLSSTVVAPQELDFHMGFYGQIDQAKSYITSTRWRYNNQWLELADEYISGNPVERNLYVFTRTSNGAKHKIIKSIGKLNVTTGKMLMEAIPTSNSQEIQISAIPNAYDIATVRDQLITVKMDLTAIQGERDRTFDHDSGDRTYNTIPRFQE